MSFRRKSLRERSRDEKLLRCAATDLELCGPMRKRERSDAPTLREGGTAFLDDLY